MPDGTTFTCKCGRPAGDPHPRRTRPLDQCRTCYARAWRNQPDRKLKLREYDRTYRLKPEVAEKRRVMRQDPEYKARATAYRRGSGYARFRRHHLGLLIEAFDGRCAYCQRCVKRGAHEPDSATIDRVVPRRLGGEYEMGNVVLSCWSCNASKAEQTVEEWLPNHLIA